MFKYLLYLFGLFVIHRFPIAISYRLAEIASDIQCMLSPRDRRSVASNLRAITGKEENISYLTREVFRNFGRYLVEFFFMKKMVDATFVKQKIKLNHVEYFQQALAKGKGAILVTGHIGNWELGAVIMQKLGYNVVAIALPHKERPVNDLFNEQRQMQGLTIVPPNSALRKCMEALKENKIVAIVADRDFSMHGEIMDFLGKKTLIPKGAALFSIRTGAPIIPAFILRDEKKKDSFNLIVCKPIYPPDVSQKSDQEKEEITMLMIKQYLKVIEDKIYAYPDQWLMFREYGV